MASDPARMPRGSGGVRTGPTRGRQLRGPIASHVGDPVADGECVVDPTAKARRIGESPTGWVGCETSALLSRHEQQPSGGVLAAQEEIPPRQNGIPNFLNLPGAIGLVREYEHPEVGIGRISRIPR